jgi:hypothetical protein
MPGLQATTVRLLAVLQEASDLAKAVKLADGRSVGPILAAIVQDLRDPLICPSQVAKHKPQDRRQRFFQRSHEAA